MNKIVLVGRMVRDNKVSGENEHKVLRNTIAVQRQYKNKEGNYDSDFVPISAFGKTADFIEKFFKKGDVIAITGRFTSGEYEKDGNKIYTQDITVESVEFVPGTKKDESNANTSEKAEPTSTSESVVTADDFNSLFN